MPKWLCTSRGTLPAVYGTVAGFWLCAISGCSGQLGEAQTADSVGTAEAAEQADDALHGILLGQFDIRECNPVEGSKSTIHFTLYATVRSAETERFVELLARHRHKIRDHVITATRVVPTADFDDPLLDNLRRQILSRLRRALPALPCEDLAFTQFNFELEA